ERREVDGAVLGDDPLHVVARRGDGRPPPELGHDGRDEPTLDRRRRLEADDALPARRLAGAGHECLVPADPPLLPAPDVVGRCPSIPCASRAFTLTKGRGGRGSAGSSTAETGSMRTSGLSPIQS